MLVKQLHKSKLHVDKIFPQQSESGISAVLCVHEMVKISSYSVQYTTTKVKAAAPHTR